MPNKDKKIKYILILALLGFGALLSLTSNKPEDNTVLGSKAKNENAKGLIKSVQVTEATTPVAKQHKKNITEVVNKLEEVADTEGAVGNTEASQEITEVANTAEETAADTVEAIDAVESKPKWQVLLFGSDYKNLGQLRSSLAHNTNDIRKLSRAADVVEESSSSAQVQGTLATLELERQRIYDVIKANESQFSILGWVARFFTGYTPLPIGGGVDEGTGDTGVGTTEPATTTVE